MTTQYKTYNVTITREPKFSVPLGEARNGEFAPGLFPGDYISNLHGRDLAEYLFHAVEIANVGVSPSGDVTAEILGG